MKIIKLLSLLLSLLLLLTSCGFVGESSDLSTSTNTSNTLFTIDDNTSISKTADIDTPIFSEVSSSNTETSNLVDNSALVLSIENLVLTIQCSHPNSDDRDILYFLCVQSDGSVYSLNYSIVKDGVRSYDFSQRLYSCDDSAWNYAENIELIGRLSQSDTSSINEYVSKIDMTSECYDRQRDDMGMAPEVEESVDYSIFTYLLTESGEKETFRIKSYGVNQGRSYETYDENALAALDLIQNSQFFNEWQQKCNTTNN